METIRRLICQGILLIGMSILVIVGRADWSRGESSFSGIVPFEQGQGFIVPSVMGDYDPRNLIVNFGEPDELTYLLPLQDQVFDFNVLLDAPVGLDPDTTEPQFASVEESSDAHDKQPAAIPEPSSFLLLALGLLLVVSSLWRKNDRN